MALVIIDRTKPSSNDPVRLGQRLREAQEIAEYLDDVGANATDQDMYDVFGVPVADVITFKDVVSNLVTALNAAPVDNYINNLG